MINYSIYKAQLAAIYSRHIWLTITVTTHCSLGADKPRYHRRSLATFSTIGSHRRMPISLSLSLLSCSFTKPMNPMEVTPSEFDRHPWGVCRWFKTLGACNVSPIEQVRCTKVPYRIYIYIYIYDRFPATFCVAPALQNPPIACLRGARSVSDGGTVRASAPCRRLHESLADFHCDLYRFQAVRRLFIGKPVENRLITRTGNCCESLFFYRFIDMWMAIGSFFHSSRCKPYWNNFWFL